MKQKIALILCAVCFGVSLSFAQVDKLTGTVTNDATMARLRLAHFVHGGPNVDWFVNGEIAVNGGQKQINIPVGYINGYLYLEPGTYSFTVTPTGKGVDEALLGPVDVDVVAGHRYTLAVMGQMEDEKLSSLVIDETAELQTLGATKDQAVYFLVNNVAGAKTLDLDEDGHGPKGIPYGDLGVASLPGGKFKHYAFTANSDPNAVIDSGDYGGYGELPGTDVLVGFFGHFPGTLGEDFDGSGSSPSSNLNTLELLKGFSGVGLEADSQPVSLDTFLKAVEIAGLTDLLTTGDPLLVLPPTDAAFAELPKEQLDALMADPQALSDLLRNHIIEAYVPKGTLATTPGGSFDRSFTNLLGGTTHIGDGYTVNGLNVGDIGSTFTANGTQVHPITKVLLPPTTLSLAIFDPQGRPSEPYVLEFIAQVNTLSNDSLTIEPYWDAGSEPRVIQLVKAGEADLGLVGSRAWNGEGVTNLDALQAPFLIDNDALAEAVATSDTANQMLEGLSSAGVVGLTMWPEDMRHPFAISPQPPFLSPEDFAGMNIRTTTSGISFALIKALGGNPMFANENYQGAESGLRQGGSLIGTQVATGNVTFFSKFQVLFANSASFEKLSDEQKSILQKAAQATQTKAIAEHPREVDAATAYCAEGGTVVLVSEEQIAAFEKAAQPVFDQIEQDPTNAGYITAIRELKASTAPSPGAAACEPAMVQSTEVWSKGLPPNGIWQVELNEEDLVAKGLPRGEAQAITGVTNWEFQDGKFTQNMLINSPRAGTCTGTYAVVEDFVRFNYTSGCDGEVDDIQWRLDNDGLHLHLVAVQNAPFRVNKFYYEANPWQKIE
jgi:TRAP-type C4-dicarboxylate transport system substrate-binding protein